MACSSSSIPPFRWRLPSRAAPWLAAISSPTATSPSMPGSPSAWPAAPPGTAPPRCSSRPRWARAEPGS
ncbi:Uncharacterised protein [Bordetella pertussis]|nr:Uncharacterised protein [Bordetella pertussis]